MEDVTDKQRNEIGKAVNFAIIYGQTAHGLAAQLGIAPEQAQESIDAFFHGYRVTDAAPMTSLIHRTLTTGSGAAPS